MPQDFFTGMKNKALVYNQEGFTMGKVQLFSITVFEIFGFAKKITK